MWEKCNFLVTRDKFPMWISDTEYELIDPPENVVWERHICQMKRGIEQPCDKLDCMIIRLMLHLGVTV